MQSSLAFVTAYLALADGEYLVRDSKGLKIIIDSFYLIVCDQIPLQKQAMN